MASRTGWLLWLDRLSITTRSPGASVGTSTSFTYSRKRSPLMEPSSIWVAVAPLSRSPATSVVFLRLPCGIGARRRTPRGARPYRRHVGGRKALVDEHEPLRLESELAFEPVLALLHDVGPILLGRVGGLLDGRYESPAGAARVLPR